MGFFSDLFSSDSESETTVRLSEEAKKYLDPLNDKALEALNAGAPGYYPFNPVAGLNPYINQGIDNLGNYGGEIAGSMTQYGLGGNDLLSQYYGGNQGVTNDQISGFYNSDRVNDQVGAVTNDYTNFLDKYLGTNLATEGVATGNLGSSKHEIRAGQAISDTARNLATTTSGIRDQGWRDAANTAMGNADLLGRNMANLGNQANAQLSNAYNFGGNNINNQLTAGNMLRGYDQERIGADMQQHMWDYNSDWDLMNRYYGIASPMYGMVNSKTKESYTPGLGEIGMALGSAALGGGYSPWSGTGGGAPVGSMYAPGGITTPTYTGGYGGFMPTGGGFQQVHTTPMAGGFGSVGGLI